MGREKVGLTGMAKQASVTMGQEIKIARVEKRWTQQMLAARSGMSERTVTLIERGDPAVSFGNVLNAAVAVGVPLFQIEDRDELARARHTGARVLSLLPKRVVKEDFSNVDLDF